jgi:putative nucleotidyltransferase with HDIG domain
LKNLRKRGYATAFTATVITLAFAVAWVCIQSAELWSSSLEVREGREAPVTVRLPASYFRITMLRNEYHYLTTISSSCPHLVPRGTKLIRGKECTGLVKAYEASRRPIRPMRLIGSFVFCLVVGLVLSGYMRRGGMGRARLVRSHLTIFFLLTFAALVSKVILLFTPWPSEILPIAMVPMLAAFFLGRRLSFGVAMASALLASSLVNYDIQIFLIHLIAGFASVAAIGQRRRVGVFFKAGAVAAWVAILATLVTTLLFSGTLNIYDDISEHVDPRYSLWLAGLFSGLGSGVLAWLLTPIVGAMFGEVSRGRLMDLQDLDHPLLKRLRERAPATWEHSRAMANLAEAAAHAIGANALLVRVGAYFHDVGKSYHPEFFIENQSGGGNPHDQMTPLDSAHTIFHHVTEGTRLLRQHRVPEDVVEFAFTHHGTGVLEYFWHRALSEGGAKELSERDFCYPGHKPADREAGIIMLVDSIEAAARTVTPPEKAQFEQLVQRIVYTKLARGQLDESGLSLADTRNVANTVVDTLVGMYHGRIKYPWQTTDVGEGGAGRATPHSGLAVVAAAEDAAPPTIAGPAVDLAAPVAEDPAPGISERTSAPVVAPPKNGGEAR